MNNIKKFVSRLLKDLFNEEDKKELIEILTTSLEEKVDDLVEQGTSREEAIEKSIAEFGDAEDVLEAFPEMKRSGKENLVKKRRNQLIFSTCSYLIIVALTIYINLYYIPEVLWLYFVVLGTLFWPLTMLYRYISVRK